MVPDAVGTKSITTQDLPSKPKCPRVKSSILLPILSPAPTEHTRAFPNLLAPSWGVSSLVEQWPGKCPSPVQTQQNKQTNIQTIPSSHLTLPTILRARWNYGQFINKKNGIFNRTRLVNWSLDANDALWWAQALLKEPVRVGHILYNTSSSCTWVLFLFVYSARVGAGALYPWLRYLNNHYTSLKAVWMPWSRNCLIKFYCILLTDLSLWERYSVFSTFL